MLLPLPISTNTVNEPPFSPQMKLFAIAGCVPGPKLTEEGSEVGLVPAPVGAMINQPLPVKFVTVRLPNTAMASPGIACAPVPVPAITQFLLVAVANGPLLP